MKRFYFVIAIVFCLTVIGSFLYTQTQRQNVSAQDNGGQQRILDNISANLTAEGVAVKQARIVADSGWNPPIVVDYTIQSTSKNDSLAPGDYILVNTVDREVNLAQKSGFTFGAIGVNIINTQGKTIFFERRVVENISDFSAGFNQPSSLPNSSVSALLSDLPAFGLSLKELNVSLNRDGSHECLFNMQAPDIETANSAIPAFILNASSTLKGLNDSKQAQISIYRVNINLLSGEPVLKYYNDLQMKSQSWWQSDTATKDWFPHPES